MKASTNNTPITEAGFSVRTLNLIKRAFPDAVTLGELRQAMADDPACRNLGKKTLEEINGIIAEAGTPDVPDTPNVSDVPGTAAGNIPETPGKAAFDYSLVDDDTADYLRKATAKIANSYADIGAVLSEAQERLASHDKNQGIFEKWYSSLGMKKFTVYTFIRIHNFRNEMVKSCEIRTTSENTLEIFDNLPKMLQSDISSPSAPAEAVNAVLSGDITTHKDFIALKKRLEEAENKARLISENYDRLEKVNSAHFGDLSKEREKSKELESKIQSLAEDVENLTLENGLLEKDNQQLTGENTDLEEERDRLLAENKELRKRPVETVTVSGDPTDTPEYLAKLSECDELRIRIADLEEELEEKSAPPPAASMMSVLDHENLRDIFENVYARADEAIRDCVHFTKDIFPDETKQYVERRVRELCERFKDYIVINFES